MSQPKAKNSVSRHDHQGTIKFDKIEDLHHAVLVYAGERSVSAENHTIKHIGDASGGDAALMFLKVSAERSELSFAERVVADMGTLERPYRGSWDYEGPGPFHKAMINAENKQFSYIGDDGIRVDEGYYTLDISAAHIGNDGEINLAEKIGAPIGYRRCKVNKEYEVSKGERFKIPLEEVISVFKALDHKIDEEAAYAALAKKIEGEIGSASFPKTNILEDKDLSVTIGLVSHSVAESFMENTPERDYDLRLENGFLTGPACLDHGAMARLREEAQAPQRYQELTYDGRIRKRFVQVAPAPEIDPIYRPVEISVTISPKKSPTYNTDFEQKIRALGDKVEAVLGGTPNPERKLKKDSAQPALS